MRGGRPVLQGEIKDCNLALSLHVRTIELIIIIIAKEHPMKLLEKLISPREIRRKLGLNQQDFWTQIGVTQSGGSRYESGRRMPKPVKELLRLVHVEGLDLSKLKREDVEIIEYLKDSQPDLYKSLKKAAKTGRKGEAEA
jgi:hypothetical protein